MNYNCYRVNYKMIIGISGKMGCGKDYVCNNLIIPLLKKLDKCYLQLAFADQIKINAMTKSNISFDDIYTNKTTHSRKLLQREGTELGRNVYGKDIWIKYLDNWISLYKYRGIDNFICTDVRFLNEMEYIKQKGGIIIRIISKTRNLQRLESESNGDKNIMSILQEHPSECDLDNVPDDSFDIVIQNEIGQNLDKYKDVIYSKLQQ
jgi:phosphomevalonate kinase